MRPVRVRFAPSPTGALHVGGARTAIFNWLLARRHGGVFILRIEDTDVERSTEAHVREILDGLHWLGLEPDEGPHFQSRFRERHAADALRALEAGHAYRCFCTAEDIRADRERAEADPAALAAPHRCRAIDPAESARRAGAGEPFGVRFRVPEGRTEWNDLVHGPTGFENATIEDFVLLRSDGTPTYMLSVVSDDVAMDITHVVRGDDHLSNTPKQILLYRALGRTAPEFAHLPLILGEDKKRLSKRHGATSVLEYRERGYLPEAFFNFLALLGWSPGDDRQKMDRDAIVRAFDFAGVGKSGAVFDLKKLEWLNGEYLASLPLETLEREVRARLEASGLWRDAWAGERRGWFRRVLDLLRERARTFDDYVEHGRPFFDSSDVFPYDPAAEQKHLRGEGLGESIAALRAALARAEPWEAGPLEQALRGIADARGIAAGKLIHPTRVAVTGRGVSPGIFDVLALLGKERTLARLDRLAAYLDGGREL